MRVAFDASPVRRPMGGVGRYAAELAAALRARVDPSFELVLLSNRPAALREVLSSQPSWSAAAGKGRPDAAILSGTLRRPTLAWLQLEAPALIASSGANLAHFTTGRSPLRLSVPTVLTVHDLTVLTHRHFYPRRERWLAAPWLAASIRRANAIVAVSGHTAASVAERFPSTAGRIHVIAEAPASSLARPKPAMAEARRRLVARLPVGDAARSDSVVRGRVWLTIVSMTTRKGLGILIRAVARARHELAADGFQPTLVIAGSSASDVRTRLLLQRHGLAESTLLVPSVEDDDLPYLYAAADIVVVPSLHEGFGLVALEAMSMGVPLVCTSAGALPELVGNAAEVVPPGDADALAAVLVRLQRHPKRLAELALLGPEQAAPYSWSHAASATVDVYREVLGGAG